MKGIFKTTTILILGTLYSFWPALRIKQVKPGGAGHRTLMVGELVPAWWQWIFGQRKRTMAFVGKGTKWYVWPSQAELPKWVSKQLQQREKQYSIYGK